VIHFESHGGPLFREGGRGLSQTLKKLTLQGSNSRGATELSPKSPPNISLSVTGFLGTRFFKNQILKSLKTKLQLKINIQKYKITPCLFLHNILDTGCALIFGM
jgi:hypothetical protein